jgi:hypothetical protein
VTITSKSSVPCVDSPPGVAPHSSTIARPADSTVHGVATHPARHSSRSSRLEGVRWPYSHALRTTQTYSTDFVRASRYDTISTPRSTAPLLTRDRSLSRVSVSAVHRSPNGSEQRRDTTRVRLFRHSRCREVIN